MMKKRYKKDEWVLVGTIVGTKGLDGSLKVHSSIRIVEPTLCLVGFSLNFANEYPVEKWEQSKARYSYVKLKGIDNIEEAKKLIEKGIFVKKSSIEAQIPENITYNELYGFVVIDINNCSQVGTIVGVEENPGNNLLVIEKENDTIYIPFVEQFIHKIDRDKKTVFIKSIEGLLDL
jgi:16S rRNA processing protein RimM